MLSITSVMFFLWNQLPRKIFYLRNRWSRAKIRKFNIVKQGYKVSDEIGEIYFTIIRLQSFRWNWWNLFDHLPRLHSLQWNWWNLFDHPKSSLRKLRNLFDQFTNDRDTCSNVWTFKFYAWLFIFQMIIVISSISKPSKTDSAKSSIPPLWKEGIFFAWLFML